MNNLHLNECSCNNCSLISDQEVIECATNITQKTLIGLRELLPDFYDIATVCYCDEIRVVRPHLRGSFEIIWRLAIL
jgi:hypothetical protein